MSAKRDGQKGRGSQFLLDYVKSIGLETSLRKGGEEELFGHYWTDFVKELQKDSSKNAEKRGTSSESFFFKPSSEDPENIYKPVDKDFVETNVSFPNEFDKEREVVGILEDRGQPDSRSGICFTETQEKRAMMQSQMELPSTSKQQSGVKPVSDKLQKDSENLSIESSHTEPSVREAGVTTEEELPRKQVRKKALAKDEKFFLEDLHCGRCGTRFGSSKTTLGKLIYRCSETEFIRNVASFKCLSCSTILNAANTAKRHFVNHVKMNNLYCMECQIKMNDGKTNYDLETFDIPVKTPFEETNPKFLNLSHKSVVDLLKLSPSCAACPTRFGDISEKLYRLFEIHHSEAYKPVLKSYIYCCIICSWCCSILYDIEIHLLHHFHGNDVLCRKCYGGVASKNLCCISSTQTVYARKAKRLVNFNTSLKINCGKSGEYLSESAVLEPIPVKMFQKSIEGDVLKIRKENLYKCVLCLNAFNDIEIVKHIMDHINSNHIACINCQDTYDYGVASIRRIASRLGNYEDARCTICKNTFSEKDLQPHFSAFSIVRTENKQSTSKIFVCIVCKRAFLAKSGIMHHFMAHISNKQIFCNSCATKMNIQERLLQQHD